MTRGCSPLKSNSLLRNFFIVSFLFGWSVLTHFLMICLRTLAFFKPKFRKVLEARDAAMCEWNKQILQTGMKKQVDCFLFCSSAGEYEQALPLIKQLKERGLSSLVLIFSPSGYHYIKARGDKHLFLMTPIDSLWSWKAIFDYFEPKMTFIVRHELWPCFLWLARHRCQSVYLINASLSEAESRSVFRQKLKSWFGSFLSGAFVLSEKDLQAYERIGFLEKNQLVISGDTKFDRVIDRAKDSIPKANAIRKMFSDYLYAPSRLVVGSAWPKDLSLSLDALVDLSQMKPSFYQAVVAMHQVDDESLALVKRECCARGLRYVQYTSFVAASNDLRSKADSFVDVVIVDCLGVLAEVYASGHLAFVGGASHYEVHNVLEPASYGLALAYGPLYHNSVEAVTLVDRGIGTVIRSKQDMIRWWQESIENDYCLGSLAKGQILESAGAARKIVEMIKFDLRKKNTFATRLPQ